MKHLVKIQRSLAGVPTIMIYNRDHTIEYQETNPHTVASVVRQMGTAVKIFMKVELQDGLLLMNWNAVEDETAHDW